MIEKTINYEIVLSLIHIFFVIYHIIIFTISMKSMKDYDELKKKNEMQAKKIKELTSRLIKNR